MLSPPDFVLTIADDSRERKRTGQLNLYYDAVIAGIRAADSLLIFGPGEAKGELAKRLERQPLQWTHRRE